MLIYFSSCSPSGLKRKKEMIPDNNVPPSTIKVLVPSGTSV
jgi:hypothetical protein